jgi:hypothetical protein
MFSHIEEEPGAKSCFSEEHQTQHPLQLSSWDYAVHPQDF